MKKIITYVLAVTLVQAVTRESIRTGEQGGIPDRADKEKITDESDQKEEKEKKGREVKENQEDTDPVFYDSTTSPEEMDGTGTL